jgi:hypothetical protein
VNRHDHHGEATSPLAHPPVTRHDVSGPGRLPVALRVDRRDAERTPWAACVHKHCPDRPLPTTKKARARLQQAVDPMLWAEAALQTLHQPLRTQIDLGMAWFEAARHPKVPWSVLVCDSWSLAEAWVSMARSRHKDWSSWLKTPRHLEPHSVVLQAAAGPRLPLAGPPMAVEDLVPLMPRTASRAVTGQDTTSWTCP